MKEFNGIVLKMNLRGSVLKINLYLDSFGFLIPTEDAKQISCSLKPDSDGLLLHSLWNHSLLNTDSLYVIA